MEVACPHMRLYPCGDGWTEKTGLKEASLKINTVFPQSL